MNTVQTKVFFRDNIAAMSGYVPGEQPKVTGLLKLNTNENPYPPSPAVKKVLRNFDSDRLRLYPDPVGCELRNAVAELYSLETENVLLGNGSDDILTIIFRSFVGDGDRFACFYPSYSLYPVLAAIQNVECCEIVLNQDFSLPEDTCAQAENARLLIVCRPNAPTGNSFSLARLESLCHDFSGIVVIDEAYAEFADDNCLDFVRRYDNVIVSRTLSKSYSLAGVRLGYALASPELIEGMMKVKDSYNVNALTQALALAAVRDQDYLRETRTAIIKARDLLSCGLCERGFTVIPSQSNFVFASPPDRDGKAYFDNLREANIIVRYFPGQMTGDFVRITVGKMEEMKRLLEITGELYDYERGEEVGRAD